MYYTNVLSSNSCACPGYCLSFFHKCLVCILNINLKAVCLLLGLKERVLACFFIVATVNKI